MISTGQALRQRRRQRPARVDDAPDRERTLPADDLPDPAAGDHQRRHHQRVERDRRLDPDHIGPDVLGDRRDRRVHHRHVQGHDELPRRQREQHQTRSLGSSRRRGRRSRHDEDPISGWRSTRASRSAEMVRSFSHCDRLNRRSRGSSRPDRPTAQRYAGDGRPVIGHNGRYRRPLPARPSRPGRRAQSGSGSGIVSRPSIAPRPDCSTISTASDLVLTPSLL